MGESGGLGTLPMPELTEITQFLNSVGLPPLGKIVANPSIPKGYFVPLARSRDASGAQAPSGRALASARSTLLKGGYTIDFILINEEFRIVEESLRASLINSFPNEVRNLYYSASDTNPQAWIDFKKQPDADIKRRIAEHLDVFSRLFSLPGIVWSELGETKTPTKSEILSAVRQLAPIDIGQLVIQLESQGLVVPSPEWARRTLDALRKSKLVIRKGDGRYILTMEALSRLGSRKGNQSPDVRRILALARRGA